MRSRGLLARRLRAVAIGALALAALALALARAVRLPDGPEPIAWDREACAACRMHVGDPRFAAQLQTTDGQVRSYDDPGCLLSDLAAARDAVHAVWFHDSRSDRWLPAADVGFVPAGPTPMGYGLAAVARKDEPGSLDLAAATRRVQERDPRHGEAHAVRD